MLTDSEIKLDHYRKEKEHKRGLVLKTPLAHLIYGSTTLNIWLNITFQEVLARPVVRGFFVCFLCVCGGGEVGGGGGGGWGGGGGGFKGVHLA